MRGSGLLSRRSRRRAQDLPLEGQPYGTAQPGGKAGFRRAIGPVLTLKPAAVTAANPVLPEDGAASRDVPMVRPYMAADPLDPAVAVRPLVRAVIGDSIPAPAPLPEPPAPPAPGTSPVLYAGEGWARRLMSMRVADGNWDELPAIVERGLGRNAAEEAAGFRHSRTLIAEGMLQHLAVLGRPDLAAPLLYRVHELNAAARQDAAGGAL